MQCWIILVPEVLSFGGTSARDNSSRFDDNEVLILEPGQLSPS